MALFVTDAGNNTIRQITFDGTVTTLYGSPEKKVRDGMSDFDTVGGITSSPDGTLFVTDYGLKTIRKITVDGTVTTLCGSPMQRGSEDGNGSTATFDSPHGITSSPDGTLFVTDIF